MKPFYCYFVLNNLQAIETKSLSLNASLFPSRNAISVYVGWDMRVPFHNKYELNTKFKNFSIQFLVSIVIRKPKDETRFTFLEDS